MQKTYLMVFLVLFFLFSPIFANDYALKYKVVNVAENDTLNVRQNPHYKSDKVGELYPNNTVSLHYCKKTDKDTKWCLIEDTFVNLKGWVNAKFLKPDTAATFVNLIRTPTTIYIENKEKLQKVLLTKTSDCYFALKCEKKDGNNMCRILYHDKISNKNIVGWVKREDLIGADNHTAVPSDPGFDGYCGINEERAKEILQKMK